jgi:cell division protein FtsB
MNPFEFVITLMVVIFAFRIISHRMGMRTGLDRRWANQQLEAGDPRETAQLRDEVRELKERIKVLERIAVDKENSLAKEIESLRDR